LLNRAWGVRNASVVTHLYTFPLITTHTSSPCLWSSTSRIVTVGPFLPFLFAPCTRSGTSEWTTSGWESSRAVFSQRYVCGFSDRTASVSELLAPAHRNHNRRAGDTQPSPPDMQGWRGRRGDSSANGRRPWSDGPRDEARRVEEQRDLPADHAT
jgi:hypothetical protein